MGLKEQVKLILNSVKDYSNVNIIAATKYLDVSEIKILIENGITNLGENRTDSFLQKYQLLKDYNLKWHFIGSIQTRKIKDIANKIDYLHSLDKISTAIELNKRLIKPLDCFVQINISKEETKQGINEEDLIPFIKQLKPYKQIRVVGLMCLARLTNDVIELRETFNKMRLLQIEVNKLNLDYAPCTRLSMGMSNDYKIALECGATEIRLGRIFLD